MRRDPKPRRNQAPTSLAGKLRKHSPWLLLFLWFALSLYFFLSATPPAAAPALRRSGFRRPKPRALSLSADTAAPPVRIYVYDLPARFNGDWVAADARCARHLFAAEVAVHQALLSYPGRADRPEDADLFFVPVYVSCNFSTPNGFPSLSHARGLLADAVQLVRSDTPYWNRSAGADHVFVASHDFGACFHPMGPNGTVVVSNGARIWNAEMGTQRCRTSSLGASLLASSPHPNDRNLPREFSAVHPVKVKSAAEETTEQPRRRPRRKKKSRILDSPTPATESSPTLRMEYSYDAIIGSQEFAQEFNYTPGIEIGEPYVHPTQPLDSQSGEGFVTSPPLEALAGQGKQITKNVPRREKNYSPQEDELLCASYLNVSKDSIVGCNQTGGGYWKRIHEYYHAHKNVSTERSRSSLQHRWSIIQKETTKFCGFYEKIVRRNESGKNDDDKLREALQMYQGVIGSPFSSMHCWLILRHERKWNDWLATLKQNDNPTPPSPATEQGSNPDTFQVEERPMGRDRAKNRGVLQQHLRFRRHAWRCCRSSIWIEQHMKNVKENCPKSFWHVLIASWLHKNALLQHKKD